MSEFIRKWKWVVRYNFVWFVCGLIDWIPYIFTDKKWWFPYANVIDISSFIGLLILMNMVNSEHNTLVNAGRWSSHWNLNLYFNILTSIIGFVITGLTYRDIGFSGNRGDHKRPEDRYSDKIAEEISSDQVFAL